MPLIAMNEESRVAREKWRIALFEGKDEAARKHLFPRDYVAFSALLLF